MDEAGVVEYVSQKFAGLDVVSASGNTFFFCDPGRSMDPRRRLPFATIVTSDAYDSVSNIDRAGVFRLNVGVSRETYRSMFGDLPRAFADGSVLDTGHDYSALDRIMPHPIYASMGWICILNPGQATFKTVKPLLDEAYDIARDRHRRRTGGGV